MPNMFVYGTLKNGYTNAPLLSEEKFLGKAVSKESDFRMYEVGGHGYKYPALVKGADGYQVYGELYSARDECVPIVDRLEGVSIALYKRETAEFLLVDGSVVEAFVYLYLRDLKGLAHVGPCWPKDDAKYFKFADKVVKKGKEGLYLESDSKAISPEFEELDQLCDFATKNLTLFGGAKGTSSEWGDLLLANSPFTTEA